MRSYSIIIIILRYLDNDPRLSGWLRLQVGPDNQSILYQLLIVIICIPHLWTCMHTIITIVCTIELIHPFMRLRRHHYEVIIIDTWYEFAHQSSPLSQHTLCESIVY